MAKNDRNYKILVISLLLIVVALLSGLIAVSVLYSNSKTPETTSPVTPAASKICMEKECISAASQILKNMDFSADPCEDFNRYTCGKFIDNRRIPDDQSSDDTFGVLRINLAYAVANALEKPIDGSEPESTKMSKTFYASCLNEAQIEKTGVDDFKKVVQDELGGWPLINQNVNLGLDGLDVLKKFFQIGVRPWFALGLVENPKNPDYFFLETGQAGWFFDKKYYNDTTVMAAYKTYITKVATILNDNKPVDEKEVDAMITLEKEFGKYLYNVTEKRSQKFKTISIEELEKAVPAFKWTDFIVGKIYADFGDSKVTKNDTILVNEWNYLTNASQVYTKALVDQRQTLLNLMVWSFVKDRTTYLPKVFRDARLDFDKVYSGTTAQAARSRTCANAILDRMPYAVGRLYVQDNFEESAKQSVEDMVANIRAEFDDILAKVDWMDEESNKKAKEKAATIDVKMAYPEFTYNKTYLDTLYKDYVFDNQTYLKNAIIVSKSQYKETFMKLKEKNKRKDWFSGPAVVNAFYSPPANQICFPAGILQAPFFDARTPNYLNYGGIGVVIGHEITHGFDDQGKQYDKDGVFFDDTEPGLWTNATIQNYKQRAQCIIDQYSSYKAKQVDMNLIGQQTQGENIADNGGIKESFGAYQRWVSKNGQEKSLPGLEQFTPEQMFFINYGQIWCTKWRAETLKQRILTGVHSPGEFRIIGPTSNFPEFAKAFKCKANTSNNPDKKCAVW